MKNLVFEADVAACIGVNFGGPRSQAEIASFLNELLTDQEVVRTPLPKWIHKILFGKIAKKRSHKLAEDYAQIGGCSPIYEDTEAVMKALGKLLPFPTLSFHRYLPATHAEFIDKVRALPCGEIRVFPFFPQFSYATTGSIAKFFHEHFPKDICQRLRWIKSYPAHHTYIQVMRNMIEVFMQENQLVEEQTLLLFSAHGLPASFIQQGDVYLSECKMTFKKIAQYFPKALSRLSFQSKFGPGEWIRPYTSDFVEKIEGLEKQRSSIVVVPLSFTSDHIETLFEIEEEYLPPLRSQGFKAFRLPAMNRRSEWVEAIASILQEEGVVSNRMLLRKN
jgi:ferrochelatase